MTILVFLDSLMGGIVRGLAVCRGFLFRNAIFKKQQGDVFGLPPVVFQQVAVRYFPYDIAAFRVIVNGLYTPEIGQRQLYIMRVADIYLKDGIVCQLVARLLPQLVVFILITV